MNLMSVHYVQSWSRDVVSLASMKLDWKQGDRASILYKVQNNFKGEEITGLKLFVQPMQNCVD